MGRPISFPSPWLELAQDAGNVDKLAKALSVSPMTLWRWAHGKKVPSLDVQLRLNAYADGRKLKAPFPKAGRDLEKSTDATRALKARDKGAA